MRKQTQETAVANIDSGLVKINVVAQATSTSERTVQNWQKQKKFRSSD
jgi:hypothetical protein